MKQRLLKEANIKVSEIGLGTWQFGGDFGEVEEETALKILEKAVDSGINFLIQ